MRDEFDEAVEVVQVNELTEAQKQLIRDAGSLVDLMKTQKAQEYLVNSWGPDNRLNDISLIGNINAVADGDYNPNGIKITTLQEGDGSSTQLQVSLGIFEDMRQPPTEWVNSNVKITNDGGQTHLEIQRGLNRKEMQNGSLPGFSSIQQTGPETAVYNVKTTAVETKDDEVQTITTDKKLTVKLSSN